MNCRQNISILMLPREEIFLFSYLFFILGRACLATLQVWIQLIALNERYLLALW
jgi:hypothetical protein